MRRLLRPDNVSKRRRRLERTAIKIGVVGMTTWRRTQHEAPSITVESAEGETSYPGFNGDAASDRARARSVQRLDEIRSKHERAKSASTPHERTKSPSAPRRGPTPTDPQ